MIGDKENGSVYLLLSFEHKVASLAVITAKAGGNYEFRNETIITLLV